MESIITKDSIEKTVIIKNGKEMVRSDKLAIMFEKQHKIILETIKTTMFDIVEINSEKFKAEYSTLKQTERKNFKTKQVGNENFFNENRHLLKEYFLEDKTQTSKNKEYTRYYLTRKGFDLIALSLKGERALKYKMWYIDAFHDKQKVIEEHKLTAKLNKADDLWLQFRNEGKVFRNKLTKAIQETVTDYRETIEKKMNDGKYYYHYTSLIYGLLNIDLPKGENPRDVFDKRMLVRLEDMEDKVADLIYKYSKDLHYKEVYKKIKEELDGK